MGIAPNPLEAAFDAPLLDDEFQAQEQTEEPISDDTAGLLQLGSLTDTVDVGNHEIRVRTLRIGEELNAALLANKYKDTVEEGRALATALVAAAIVTVDGEPLLGQPLGPRDNSLEQRFDYILNNWYWDTVEKIWVGYNALLTRLIEATDDLKKE